MEHIRTNIKAHLCIQFKLEVVVYRLPGALFSPSLKNKKNSPRESLHFFKRKLLLYFRKLKPRENF